jgi:hypothetical protein
VSPLSLLLCVLLPLLLEPRPQQVSSAAAASSSRQAAAAAAAQGAWSPWICVPAQDGQSLRPGADAADTTKHHIDPRHLTLTGPLVVTLGQPVTLHFVAVDFSGCPVALSKQQRRELRVHGLLLQPENGEGDLFACRALEGACSATSHLKMRPGHPVSSNALHSSSWRCVGAPKALSCQRVNRHAYRAGQLPADALHVAALHLPECHCRVVPGP